MREQEGYRRPIPDISFPPELPVVEQRARISEAIQGNQVVIIAGETGSGKTTQLPKSLHFPDLSGFDSPDSAFVRAEFRPSTTSIYDYLLDASGLTTRINNTMTCFGWSQDKNSSLVLDTAGGFHVGECHSEFPQFRHLFQSIQVFNARTLDRQLVQGRSP